MDGSIENTGDAGAGSRPGDGHRDSIAGPATPPPTFFAAIDQAAPFPRRPRPPKLYRTGDLASYARTSRQTIHNYTTMGLIQETRWTDGGHRLYDENVFGRIDEILAMRAQRRSMKDIRLALLGRNEQRAGPG